MVIHFQILFDSDSRMYRQVQANIHNFRPEHAQFETASSETGVGSQSVSFDYSVFTLIWNIYIL